MNQGNVYLSIVLPAYNEEKNIAEAIDDISSHLNNYDFGYEVVVTNDGSTDRTAEILSQRRKNDPRIRVVTHEKNIGYGGSLRSGLNAAKGKLIFFTDTDRQFDIREIKLFFEKIKDYDFVVGFREHRKDPWQRILYATIFRWTAAIFFGVRVRDVDCAFKLFRAEVLKNITLTSTGALVNLEIFALAKKRGYKFMELAVSHFPRKAGKQTGGSFRVIFKAAINMIALWWRLRSAR